MSRHSLIVGFIMLSATSVLTLPCLGDPPKGAVLPPVVLIPTRTKVKPVARDLGRLPLSFERNEGQADAKVRFLTHSGDSALFLTPSEAVFTLPAQPSGPFRKHTSPEKKRGTQQATQKIMQTALRMQMVGSDPKASSLQQQPLEGRINYFIGKDPSKWHAGVPTFGRVGFHQVYHGVDLIYYGNQRHLEYDFIVAPHADPRQIKLHFAGAQGVNINASGELVVRVQGRELKWQKPTVYQQDGAGKHSVAARFRLKRLPNGKSGVSFALGRYDTALPLVIDPLLTYSTYLGGSDNDAATSIAVDSSGNAYITGYAYSTDFPVTSGAYETVTVAHSATVFVTKLDAAGSGLVYSTYLGGGTGGNGDGGAAIAVDSNGNAYITGYAGSRNFPVTSDAFQKVNKSLGSHGYLTPFLTKLNATGSALLYSTYLGGSGSDQTNGLAIDSAGNAYVTGVAGSDDFPVTPGAFQQTKAMGIRTSFVTKLNSAGSALVYSTYLGGSIREIGTGIAVDGSGSAYVSGTARSIDFPTTPGAFQRVNKGSGFYPDNAFVTKFNASGSALVYSTYLGGTNGNSASGIAIDGSGNAYVTGLTDSADFPITPGAFQRVNPQPGSGYGTSFVTKFNATGSALVYSTYLGGTVGGSEGILDGSAGIAVDSSGNAVLAGHACSINFPTTAGAFQRVNRAQGRGYGNAFVTKLNATGTSLIYSTYLGGSGGVSNDQANGVALDSDGNVYVTGYAYSTDFPITPGAFQRSKGIPDAIGTNAFVTKLPTSHTANLFLRNRASGEVVYWNLNGPKVVGTGYIGAVSDLNWNVVATADLFNTGNQDLIWQNSASGELVYWELHAGTLATTGYLGRTPDLNWKVVGTCDLFRKNHTDLIWQNSASGEVVYWDLNAGFLVGSGYLGTIPDLNWKIVAATNFSLSGNAELIWRNSASGALIYWELNAGSMVGSGSLGTVNDLNWNIVGKVDLNSAGTTDLIWQNSASGEVVYWEVNATGVTASGFITTVTDPNYKIRAGY